MSEIRAFIIKELKDLFSVDLTEDLYNESFFSTKIGLEARNFIDLVYSIEKKFNIQFEESALVNSTFPTFNGLIKELEKFE